MVYTSADIINSIKRDNTLVSTSFRFTDSDIYDMVTECIRSEITPVILSLNASYLIFEEYVTLVAGTQKYQQPYRAAAAIENLIWQDTNDDAPDIKIKLRKHSLADGEQIITTASEFYGYYNSGMNIIPLPRIPETGTGLGYLKFIYYIEHPELVATSAVAKISSVNYNTGVITLQSNAPSTFTSSQYYDFIVANDRSNPRIVTIDKQASAVSGTSITFTVADIPTGLVSGDRVVLSGQTDVLLLPKEAFQFITKSVAHIIQDAQGDLDKLNITENSIIKLRRLLEKVLTPRNKTEPDTVVVNNGLLRNRNIVRARLPNTRI